MRDAYEEALETLVGLGVERALILQGPAPLKARISHGFDSALQWSDQVSLGILERSLEGEPLLVGDVSSTPFAERASVQLTGICSVICVPFWSPSSRILGLLYVDTRSLKNAFTRTTMNAVLSCARRLERTLYGGPVREPDRPVDKKAVSHAPPQAQQGAKLGLRRSGASASLSSPPSTTTGPLQPNRQQASPRSLVVFLRAFSTLIASGINIHRSLVILGQHETDEALRQTCTFLAAKVATGSKLSASMLQCPGIFQSFDCSIVQVGEQCGALDRVLVELADLRERQLNYQMRLKNALAYPLLVSALSLVGLLLAPPLVLRGQLELIRQIGQEPPMITKILMGLSDAMVSPVAWVLAVACVALTFWSIRRSPQLQAKVTEMVERLPIVRRLLLNVGCSRFAHGLALTYKVGIPIEQCLILSTQLSGLNDLQRELPALQSALRQGHGFASMLAGSQCLPISFAALTRAGEESGKLDTLLAWISRFYEMEFETDLDGLLSLLQPLLILVIGLMVGVLLLATLLPMVNLVQQL